MKQHLILLAAVLGLARPCAAQHDLSEFIGMGPQQILQVLGPEGRYVTDYDYPLDGVEYPDLVFYFTKGTGHLEIFETKSPAVTVLSNFIPGGIRVGDPLSRLRLVDFARTRFGRNKPRNGLRKVERYTQILGEDANYVLFSEEHMYFCFAVRDGVIRAICLDSRDDIDPDYDAANHIFAEQ